MIAPADQTLSYLPGAIPAGWPAPYAEAQLNPWVNELMKGLPLAIAVLDFEGRISGGNDALLATVGPDAAIGTDPLTLFAPADRSLVGTTIQKVITGEAGSCEISAALIARPDEKQLFTIAPVPPGLGVACMIALRDVREQRRLEAQVQAATRMQAVGQLAGGIAHDFNNILTAVIAFSEQIIERHTADDVDHKAAFEIRRNAQRAAALVAQLLAFARRQPQRAQLLDLPDLVHGLQPLLVQLIGRSVALEIIDKGFKGVVRADPGQIEQVIVNLAVNARDAMSGRDAVQAVAQGHLRISLGEVKARKVAALGHPIMPAIDHISIEVEDSGTGISPAIAGKIFEPFFTTKKLGEGTGLGLSTVYGIVKQSGGFIFARPAPKQGTIFSIYLPAHAPAAQSDKAVPAEAAQARQSPEAGLAGKQLLLVEDEAAVRDVLALGLGRKGLIVHAVADAEAALSILAENPSIDAVLSDVMMPGIDGVELATRARGMRPDMAVLLMSGFAEPPLHKAAEIAGIGFIAKPFSLSELMVALDEALRHH
jgi:two-component system cell cycle sensor histidine kinase/response regulator CckA